MAMADVLKESWQLVSGLKLPIFIVFLIYSGLYLALIPLTFLTFILFPKTFITGNPVFNPPMIVVFSVIFILITYATAIAIVLGVRQAIGLRIRLKTAFNDCMKVKKDLFFLFLFLIVLMGLLEFTHYFIIPEGVFGNILLILIYLALSYFILPLFIFALPLIVTKRTKVADAIESSYHMMNRYWLVVYAAYIIMSIIISLSMVPLGIGLIWTIPMYFALIGILFRNAYGLKRKKQ